MFFWDKVRFLVIPGRREQELTLPRHRRFRDLPPTPVMEAMIDTYFFHVHNQPYSYFQEDSFRQRLECDTIPKCLILAILASSLKFSSHEYFHGYVREATDAYAREAWLLVLDDYMSSETPSNLYAAQTMNMLAIIDFTSGRTSSGWLKIGMAVRIAQDLQLMKEPSPLLPEVEQEEQRRVFWSIYLLDKLVSCQQGRPPALYDEDCQVRLPYSEEAFKNGGFETTITLYQFFSWDIGPDVSLSPLSLVILASSALGRCARYILHEPRTEEPPPWAPKSEFNSINSLLMLCEHHIQADGSAFETALAQYRKSDQSLDQQQVGHLLFSRVLFHVCHCLLNHPPLLRLRLQKLHCTVSSVFLTRTIQTSCEHACQLAKLLDAAASRGCHVQSSFYAYAAFLAGSILSIVIQAKRRKNEAPSVDLVTSSQQALRTLENMGSVWDHASKMHLKALLFDSNSSRVSELLDASSSTDIDPATQEMVWSTVDYGAMVSEVRGEQYLKISSAETPAFMSVDLGLDLGLDGSIDSHSNFAQGEITETMSCFSSSDLQYLL
ncbi:unnamed protein product [Clonostachys byssicola]|uniref:Xylanolytic transcriptional activator regulatory domain-containing protein n=1 Tax=Clonostachys byssicola TaxID=160290 RepID=A0A9N9XZC4_9HYPO|nr:unnamed protein product [Clonostachys byssicola]